jgi:hypothetical protein
MLRHAVRSLTVCAISSVESLGVGRDSGVATSASEREGSDNGKITAEEAGNGRILPDGTATGIEVGESVVIGVDGDVGGGGIKGGEGGGIDKVGGGLSAKREGDHSESDPQSTPPHPQTTPPAALLCSTASGLPTPPPQPTLRTISMVIGDSSPSTISPADSSLRSKFPREDDRAVVCSAFLTDARRLPLPLQSIRSSLTTRVLVCRVGSGDGVVESVIASSVK